jgi:pyrroline-5-carboxylate reductase
VNGAAAQETSLVTKLAGARLALIGAGNMGFAMLQGWAAGGLAGPNVAVIEPNPSPQLRDLCAACGFPLLPAPETSDARDAVVLAIKPQMLDIGAAAAAPFVGPQTLIVSILAGKRIIDLSARLPGASAFVRAMPNTPAAVGRGITGAFASPATSPHQRACADALLAAIGKVEWLDDEAQIDALTAVSGSGPAYVFYLVEALAAAGVEAGLPAALAQRLARATVEGAGELLYRQPETAAATLRERVTSPGGTTAAALAELMAEDGLAPLMTRAVAAAQRRAGELSG